MTIKLEYKQKLSLRETATPSEGAPAELKGSSRVEGYACNVRNISMICPALFIGRSVYDAEV